ncbi:GntR family transcriptional regulator [Novosphingobium lindaniclasticum]
MAAIDPHTHERVYMSLKAEYRAGLLEPGRRLDLQELADRLHSSKTPLREAASRLLGERLLERHPDGGFMVAVYTEYEQIQLYAWNSHLLISLIQILSAGSIEQVLIGFSSHGKPTSKVEIALLTGLLFERFASAAGNDYAVDTVRSMNERLLYLRIAEPSSLAEATREFVG